jgi:Ca2+-binding EF-hand superfamily protein
MMLARTALFGAVSLALAAGSAFAADKPKSRFDKLDANNDGAITKAEAAGSPQVSKNFEHADKNNDGKLSRAEYRAAFPAKQSAKQPAKTSERKDRDPGFNALDKNNDGAISQAEAAGNPWLAERFKTADKNHDGKLNRTEYLAAIAKKDLNTAKEKISNVVKRDRQPSASTGSTR